MDFIKKRIKGLTALITAAAVTMSSLPMTAAAESSTEPITVNVTTEKYEFVDYTDYKFCWYTDSQIKEYQLSADTSIKDIAKTPGLIKDFYEIDSWNLWGSSLKSGYDIWGAGNRFTVIDGGDYSTLVYSSSNGEGTLTMSKAQEAKTIARENNKTSFDDDYRYKPLLELKTKPTTYTINVYESEYDKEQDKKPVFEFKTDIEHKDFPNEELADKGYLQKLQLSYTDSQNNTYYSMNRYIQEYDNGKYSDMTDGETFWGFLSAMAKIEQGNSAEFDFDNLNVYLYKPSIILNITRDGIDYKYFSDGKITADENEYIAEHSTAGNVWRVSHGNATYKYDYVSGDELANFVWNAIVKEKDDVISLDLVEKIYVVNKIGNSLDELIGTEDSDANGKFRNVINDNISTYRFGTAPISIEEAARSLGIITPYQTLTEWTVYGVAFWGNDDCYAYMSNGSKKNNELNSADDFNFDNNERVFVPIVVINAVEEKKFEILCDEAEGGKLVYTENDHSAFPAKDGVDYRVFTYGSDTYLVYNAQGLWDIISEINTHTTYDSSLAKLSLPTAWHDAMKNADMSTGDIIITAPTDDFIVPKYVFEELKSAYNEFPKAFIKFSGGITWEITTTTIDTNNMSDAGVDLTVMFSDTLSSGLENVKNTQYKTEISFKHTGDFGFAGTLHIDLSEQMKNAPEGEFIANYFEVNDKGEMEWKLSQTLDRTNVVSLSVRRANKMAIIVCRDKLDGSVIRDAEIEIAVPVNGGDAAKAPTVKGGAVIEKFEWSPKPVDGKFAADTAYTLSVYLKASGSAAFSKYMTASVNGADANVTVGENENIIVTYTFPKTAADNVSAPVISPNGGSFTGSQTVTITCATDGAAIYYTTDGTVPTTASTKYTGAFTLTESATVKAIAVKDNAYSAVVSAAFIKRSSGGGSGSSSGSGSTVNEPVKPTINGRTASWTDIAAELARLANGSEVTIDLNGSYNVPAAVIKVIADKDLKATFVVDSRRSWYLDGAEIETPAAADMTVSQITSLDSSSLRGTAGAKFHINGTNNPTALTVSFQKSDAGKFANLYRKDGKKLVFVGVAKVDANGAAKVSASDKGDYVLMLGEYSDLPGDMDNDGALTATDASAALKYTVALIDDGNVLAADIDGDGAVTARDAAIILKRIVGLE